jgi:IMP dehydrogenase
MMFMRHKLTVCFDDVLLVPKYSDVVSRQDIDCRSSLHAAGNFRLPIISSPMDTVTEKKMAVALGQAGGLGIIHRYNKPAIQAELVKAAKDAGAGRVGGAVGVTSDYLERTKLLLKAGCDIICIDVAHGHHAVVRHAISVLRKTFGHSFHIMAGNVATLAGFNDLADWGANSIRVGIGGGSICSTRIQTGHGIPTLQSVIDCSKSDRDAVLIADGGIRNSGDIVKAIAAGADFVMLGSLLAGTSESPGDVIYDSEGSYTKVYRGMASKEAQINWRGHVSSVEGVSSLVPCHGPVREVLDDLAVGLRSGLSYSGAQTIPEFQAKSEFIRQSFAGGNESSTHILKR